MGSDTVDLRQAVAYVKGEVPADDPAPVVELDDQDSPVLRPLCQGLLVAYLIDKGDHFEFVQGRHLSAAAMTSDVLHDLAVRNLDLKARGKVAVQAYGPVFTARFDGNLEASLLLLNGFWDDLMREYVGSSPVAVVPSRDVIAFCSSDSVAGLAELHAIVSRVWAVGDHLISRWLYSRRDGCWSPVR
jgi:uncharacterized protein YtpQ (UPF0354 family)